MESSLFILLQSPLPEHTEKLLWMLGNDAPIFDDEVPKDWHEMFNAVEELQPPDEYVQITDGYVLLNWTCSYWDEAFNEYSALLSDAGFTQQAAYYWADEEEGYLVLNGKQCEQASPKATDAAKKIAKALPKGWGDKEDKNIVVCLLSLLG